MPKLELEKSSSFSSSSSRILKPRCRTALSRTVTGESSQSLGADGQPIEDEDEDERAQTVNPQTTP